MKEQKINRIQGQDQVTWFQNEDSDQSDTKSDHSDARLRLQHNQYCLLICVSLCTGLTRTQLFPPWNTA